ncbi:MAG: hypothetical protein R6U43_05395 [Candidatus Krumholzibacteriales bacterium]
MFLSVLINRAKQRILSNCGIISVAILSIIGFAAPDSSGESGVMVPGINPRDITFREGERVQYLVISEAYGIRDSSLVTFSVFRRTGSEAGIEIESAPIPADSAEAVVVRIVLSGQALNPGCSDSDSLRFESVILKKGSEPFRALTGEEKAEIDINDYFFDPSKYRKTPLPRDTLTTPAGEFFCESMEFTRSSRDEMNLGGNRAVRFEEVKALLWRSEQVPLWGLVRSEVISSRRTEIDDPSIPRDMLKSGRKSYRSILVSYVGVNKE